MAFFKSHKIASNTEAAHYRNSSSHLIGVDNWFNRSRFTLVTKYMHNSAQQKLLDYGCGNGLFLQYLLNNNWHLSLSGFDPYLTAKDMESIKILEDRGIKFHQQFEQAAETTYDVVTALDVIEHIEDDKQALVDIHKILKPDGRLLLTVPAHPRLYCLHDAAVGHYRRYNKKSMHNVLTATGFTVVEQWYFFIFLIPAKLFLKYYLIMKKLYGMKTSINELPLNPLGIFSLADSVERQLMKRGVKFPCGHSLFVHARKTK